MVTFTLPAFILILFVAFLGGAVLAVWIVLTQL